MSNRVFLFADSFGTLTHTRYSWVDKLHANYHLVNKSSGGASTQEIGKRFLATVDRIKPEDTVIIGISDPGRFYISNEKKRNEYYEMYYELFYDKVISRIHYEGCLNKIKEVAKERNLKLLVFWSFPSDYNKSEVDNWTDLDFHTCHDEDYVYDTTFENEIKPALIYISRREIPRKFTPEQLVDAFLNDNRPNHISSASFHEEMYSVVTKFINNEVKGQIMLSKKWIDYTI